MEKDLTANENLGFGVLFNKSWTFGILEPGFIKKENPNIEYLELYAVCIGIFCWGYSIKNARVIIYCDNEAVVHMINNSSSKCKNCMYLLRLIVTNNLVNNRRPFTWHVLGSKMV